MAGAAGALRGRVVPALVVERVGDGRRAKQADDLLLAHAGPQLADRRFLEQVALVDRLPVDDASTGNHKGNEGEDQHFATADQPADDRHDVPRTAPHAVTRDTYAYVIPTHFDYWTSSLRTAPLPHQSPPRRHH